MDLNVSNNPQRKSSQVGAKVFAVLSGEMADLLSTEELDQPQVGGKYTSLTPVCVKGETFLFGYHPAQSSFDIYKFSPDVPCLRSVDVRPVVGKGKDIINAFQLGNLPYLCVYTARNGVFEVYSISDSLALSQPYKFVRNHELAISKKFTTLKPFAQFGQVTFLGYRADTGYVAMYSVSVVVSSASPEVPPLEILPVWSHPWAPGWGRFAFFQFGGETFFFKTNITVDSDTRKSKLNNVNIDHVLDTLTSGTVEVGSGEQMVAQLPEALEITNVEPFTRADGQPHFITYIPSSGIATVNRFHADCMGWTQVAKFDAPVGATIVTPVEAGPRIFLVFA